MLYLKVRALSFNNAGCSTSNNNGTDLTKNIPDNSDNFLDMHHTSVCYIQIIRKIKPVSLHFKIYTWCISSSFVILGSYDIITCASSTLWFEYIYLYIKTECQIRNVNSHGDSDSLNL